VETKGKRALLRFKARQIADCEALHHFHFWSQPEPRYIYYVCRSKKFEKWYKSIKDDQGAIYEDLEEKSTSKYINCFKESTYDEVSIWKFAVVKNKKGKSAKDNKVEAIEKEIKKLRSDMNSMIGNLHNELDIQELKSTFENF